MTSQTVGSRIVTQLAHPGGGHTGPHWGVTRQLAFAIKSTPVCSRKPWTEFVPLWRSFLTSFTVQTDHLTGDQSLARTLSGSPHFPRTWRHGKDDEAFEEFKSQPSPPRIPEPGKKPPRPQGPVTRVEPLYQVGALELPEYKGY